MLDIEDRPGCMPKWVIRKLFEHSIQSTPAFAGTTPLGVVTINGNFSHFANPETEKMWLGFALGMRLSERFQGPIPSRSQRPRTSNRQGGGIK